MGKYRSKSGCLTCRQRRVKCDEVKPKCGQCGKKNRDCQWDPQQVESRVYQSESDLPRTLLNNQAQRMDIDEKEDDGEDVALAPSRRASSRKTVQVAHKLQTVNEPTGKATAGLQQPSTLPFPLQMESPMRTSASGRVAVLPALSTALPTK